MWKSRPMTDLQKWNAKHRREEWKTQEREARGKFKVGKIAERLTIGLHCVERSIEERSESMSAKDWDFYNRYYTRWSIRLNNAMFDPDGYVGDCSC